MSPIGGISNADKALSGGFGYPRLNLKAGDRARFHILSTGEDEYLAGGRWFHSIKFEGDNYSRDIFCLDAADLGTCDYCEKGYQVEANRFAVWIYCHFILHPNDNPDEEAESWKQVKVGERILFKEDVDQVLLIWMRAGRKKAWFGQFKAAALDNDDLQKHLYELKRIGEGRDDTDYILNTVEEKPLASKIWAEVKPDLVTIEEVFRSTLGRSVAPAKMSEGGSDDEVEVKPDTVTDLPEASADDIESIPAAADELV